MQRLTDRFGTAGTRQIKALRERLEATDRLRETLSYKATLARGYAVVRGGGAVVTTKAAAQKAGSLEIEFADGRLSLSGKAKRAGVAEKPPEQGTLF